MSLFISFEGGEGCGKTTQIERLCQRLEKANRRVMLIKEPGTTPLGLRLRELIKGRPWGNYTISHGAELFLFAAARAELVSKTLKPALQGRDDVVIVADRYADSTMAYQGFGRRLPRFEVETMNRLATQGVMPQLTFLLDCLPEEGLRRVGSVQIEMPLDAAESPAGGRMDEEGARRFEEEPLGFHQRVREGYLKMAASEPERWRVIDATEPVDAISDAVWTHVHEMLLADS